MDTCCVIACPVLRIQSETGSHFVTNCTFHQTMQERVFWVIKVHSDYDECYQYRDSAISEEGPFVDTPESKGHNSIWLTST